MTDAEMQEDILTHNGSTAFIMKTISPDNCLTSVMETATIVMFYKKVSILLLQDFLQASFQRNESHRIVKRACAFVAFPNVERDIVESVRLREIQNKIVKRSTDVFAAQILVDAKVVDVKRFFWSADVVVRKIFHDAKRIALNEIRLVDADKNRAAFVTQNFFELRVRIFLRVRPPQIRPPLIVHHQNLFQKSVQTVDIFFFRTSNHDFILSQARILRNRVFLRAPY